MNVIKNEGFLLGSELKFRKNMFCSPTPAKEIRPCVCPPWFSSGWMKKGGMTALFMQGGRRRVLQLCLCFLSGQFGHSSKMQESSVELFFCSSGPERISPTGVPCLLCQEHFGGFFEHFQFLQPKLLKCSLAGIVRQRWPPPAQRLRCSPKRDSGFQKKCCGQYPDCSRGAICPHHSLILLIEPHILFLAPSVWWLRMNWQDILNQSTPCIQ